MNKECVTCGMNLEGINYSEFYCPNCLEVIISRCDHCKKLKNAYKCPKCGFEGP